MITKQQQDKVIEILRPTQPKMIGIFSSFARGDNNEDSDIDILFSPQTDIGFFQLAKIQEELENFFLKRVDLVTEGGLSKYLAIRVYQNLKVIYEA